MVPLMVMLPSSAKPVLILSFDLTGSELSLVEIGESSNSPTLCLKCVLLIKTRQRSSAWALLVGKHEQNQNFPYSSLTLGTLNKMKLMLCAAFIYIKGERIRRLCMNVAFKYIWLKGLNCLTHGRIINLCIIYHSLHDYDYHLLETICALFSLFGYDYELKKVVLGTSLEN